MPEINPSCEIWRGVDKNVSFGESPTRHPLNGPVDKDPPPLPPSFTLIYLYLPSSPSLPLLFLFLFILPPLSNDPNSSSAFLFPFSVSYVYSFYFLFLSYLWRMAVSGVGEMIGAGGSSPWIQLRDRWSRKKANRSRVSRVSASLNLTDPYKTLRIQPGASESEVKKAFRRLALQVHFWFSMLFLSILLEGETIDWFGLNMSLFFFFFEIFSIIRMCVEEAIAVYSFTSSTKLTMYVYRTFSPCSLSCWSDWASYAQAFLFCSFLFCYLPNFPALN